MGDAKGRLTEKKRGQLSADSPARHSPACVLVFTPPRTQPSIKRPHQHAPGTLREKDPDGLLAVEYYTGVKKENYLYACWKDVLVDS